MTGLGGQFGSRSGGLHVDPLERLGYRHALNIGHGREVHLLRDGIDDSLIDKALVCQLLKLSDWLLAGVSGLLDGLRGGRSGVSQRRGEAKGPDLEGGRDGSRLPMPSRQQRSRFQRLD